jgi:anti-sigma B factor antagonist
MAPLTVSTTVSDALALVALRGELDLRGATILDPELARIAETSPGAPVVLDLRGLEFMDSSGLRSIMVAEAALRAAGRSMVLVRGGESVQRVFEVTRMDDRLRFVDDPAELA